MEIVKDFFLEFYEKGLGDLNIEQMMAFYNCLVDKLHWTLRKGKILYIDLEEDDSPQQSQ